MHWTGDLLLTTGTMQQDIADIDGIPRKETTQQDIVEIDIIPRKETTQFVRIIRRNWNVYTLSCFFAAKVIFCDSLFWLFELSFVTPSNSVGGSIRRFV